MITNFYSFNYFVWWSVLLNVKIFLIAKEWNKEWMRMNGYLKSLLQSIKVIFLILTKINNFWAFLWLLCQDVIILPPRPKFIVEIYVFIFLTKPWIFLPSFYYPLISMFWPHFCIIKQINLWTVMVKFTVFFSFSYFLEL